jgi:hypothetical protein
MMTQQTKDWCSKLLFWQRILFLGLFLVWIMRIGTGIRQLFVLEGQGMMVVLPYLLQVMGIVAATAYIIQQLHQSIESLKTYLDTANPLSWQEALQYQFYFWKYSCLALFVLAAWIAWPQLQAILNL